MNIFLSINFNICLGCSKKHLIEMVLLSTHNICFNICLGSQKNRLNETVLMSTHNICLGSEKKIIHPYLEACT